jgi:hypothetical protein
MDVRRGDPLGGCDLTPRGYGHLTKQLMDVTQEGKVVLVLEGGYNLQSISTSFAECVRVLQGVQNADEDSGLPRPYPSSALPLVPSRQALAAVRESVMMQEPFWELRGERPFLGGATGALPLPLMPFDNQCQSATYSGGSTEGTGVAGSVVPYRGRPLIDPTNKGKRPTWGLAAGASRALFARGKQQPYGRPYPHHRLDSWWIDIRHSGTNTENTTHISEPPPCPLPVVTKLFEPQRWQRRRPLSEVIVEEKTWAEAYCDSMLGNHTATSNNDNNSNGGSCSDNDNSSDDYADDVDGDGDDYDDNGRSLTERQKRKRSYQRQLAALAQSRLPDKNSDTDGAASSEEDIDAEIDRMIREQDEASDDDDNDEDNNDDSDDAFNEDDDDSERELYFRSQAISAVEDASSVSSSEEDPPQRGMTKPQETADIVAKALRIPALIESDDSKTQSFSFGFFERVTSSDSVQRETSTDEIDQDNIGLKSLFPVAASSAASVVNDNKIKSKRMTARNRAALARSANGESTLRSVAKLEMGKRRVAPTAEAVRSTPESRRKKRKKGSNKTSLPL